MEFVDRIEEMANLKAALTVQTFDGLRTLSQNNVGKKQIEEI